MMTKPSSFRKSVQAHGFTIVELVMVIVILGLLAVVALPKMNDSSTFRAMAFHDEVVAALRYAQKSAVSHRRLVCAVLSGSSVTLYVASANPASACGVATLVGPDGDAAYVHNTSSSIAGSVGPIYFQPSGIATTASGVTSDFAIDVTDASQIKVVGATGYVE